MRILYLANIRLPTEKAHGIQIMKTCEAFARLGHEVELVVPTRKNFIADDPFSYYGVERNFTLTTLHAPDLVRFGPLGFLFSALWFSERARLRRAFWRADVIYSRDAFVLAQYSLLGRRLVFEAHAKPSASSRFVAKHAYRTVVISNGLKEAYVAAGIPSGRIVVVPDAVDEHRFDTVGSRAEARETLGFAQDENLVVYVGHLYARKGADTLADAAGRLSDVRVVFVGGTTEDLAHFRARWGNVPNITIVGYVPPADVPHYLRAADVLVIPNSGKDEDASRFTSPMKLFEYMASGTPIVASDVPALREVLTSDEALFAAPDDAQALAEGVKQVFANRAAAITRAAAAQQKAMAYTWAKRAEHIASVFS
ncbi:MAG TPA: glycosyltransferase [Candidatus Paceibacterota bacterium]